MCHPTKGKLHLETLFPCEGHNFFRGREQSFLWLWLSEREQQMTQNCKEFTNENLDLNFNFVGESCTVQRNKASPELCSHQSVPAPGKQSLSEKQAFKFPKSSSSRDRGHVCILCTD